MAREEAARTDGIEAVSIVTPNHLHAAAAHAFLDAGIHVICNKPLTATLADARALADHARRSGLVFVDAAVRSSLAGGAWTPLP